MRKIFIGLILIYSTAVAQYNYDLEQFGEETVDFLKQPGNWDGDDFLTIALIAGGTFSLMFVDDAVRTEMLKDRSHIGSVPMEFARHWGEPVTSIGLAVILFIHGSVTDNQTTKKLGYEVGQSMIYTAALSQVLKISFGRARPYTGKDPFSLRPFQSLEEENWSLPSGHTSLAFSLSTVLANNTDSDFLKGLAYVPALMTAFSRPYYNKHWTSDVFMGAVIGYFVGEFVVGLHEQQEEMEIETFTHRPIISFSLSL